MAKKNTDQKLPDDKLVNLTLMQAEALADYLKEVHGIISAGSSVVATVPTGAEFDVILSSSGVRKIDAIKVVRAVTGLGLKEAKDLVETAPKPVKVAVSREEAIQIKRDIEAVGGQAVIVGDLGSDVDGSALAVSSVSLSDADWTETKNARRIELLVLRTDRGLDASEARELDELQEQCAAFLDQQAPLPFNRLSELEHRLRKAHEDNAP